ncbi:MAG: HlyD family type I secretion periplasmic adaptor subunit, partial [Sphingomonas hengshuiensis]
MNQMTTEFARPVVRRSSNLLLWAILAFFVIAVIWAAVTNLDRTVRATGRVIPSSELQVVSNPEGGIVQRILAKVGDTIARGAPLLTLDRTQMNGELGSGRATIGALELKIARLRAEIAGQEPRYPAVSDPALTAQLVVERAL